jgi:hypothetical protein
MTGAVSRSRVPSARGARFKIYPVCPFGDCVRCVRARAMPRTSFDASRRARSNGGLYCGIRFSGFGATFKFAFFELSANFACAVSRDAWLYRHAAGGVGRGRRCAFPLWPPFHARATGFGCAVVLSALRTRIFAPFCMVHLRTRF